MIVPSIDLMEGATVQLVGGRERALSLGDPRPFARAFGCVGEVAVVDLDAALGRGDHAALVGELLALAPCRVGGGVRDAATARRWLDLGAAKVVIGTAARPELLRQLPRERVVAALDALEGDVVVDGWRTRTGATVEARMAELAPFVGGFLVTFVEREGRLRGTALERAFALCAAAGDRALTVAGGITTAEEVAALDRAGIDAQVGMALYTGRLSLAEAFAAPLVSERADSLWPTVVCDEAGRALGLCWSSAASLTAALTERRGIYQSRTRGLWRKGERSGATQELLRVEVDCDRDALRFVVRQHGAGFCHRGCATCFGDGAPRGLAALAATLAQRREAAPADSYTGRLLADAALLRAKLVEEAGELAAAATPAEAQAEAADLLYFAGVALARAGLTFADAERELDRRALRVTRRGGTAKEGAR
jgi:phosphoribosyl-ATP pyrophosphohydrolase